MASGTSAAGGGGALGHLRVLDLTGALGQMCARILGDLGADVILVEPPEGSPARTQPPFAGDVPGPDRSLPFLNANRNKRSVALDLTNERDLARVRALAQRSDILIEDSMPGTLAALGLGYETLGPLAPGLVYVSITPFGQSGPHRDYKGGDLIAEATGGVMFATGDDELPPVKAPYDIMAQMACMHAAFGALVALRERSSSGRGQHVDVSRQEVLQYSQNGYRSVFAYENIITRRPGKHTRTGAVNTFLCADGGYANLSVFNAIHFSRLATEIMNHPVLSAPGWTPRNVRQGKQQEIDGYVEEYFAAVDRDEVVERGQRIGVPIVPVLSPTEFVHHPHTVGRGFFEELAHPVVGTYRAPGPPFILSATPVRHRMPAPGVGEHSSGVLAEALDGTATAPAPAEPAPRRLPLEGVRVADFTRAFAGSLATMLLGFFGAEVIKIESEELEDSRSPGQATFPDLQRNKMSCTIDTRTDEGKALARRLVSRSNVVIENFRAGVMERMGLSYDVLQAGRGDLVMVSMPGMGSTGPFKDFFTYGQQILGMTGLVHTWGHADSPLGAHAKIPFPDYVAAIFSAMGALAALEHLERTGRGQHVEVAQIDGAAHLNAVAYLDHTVNGRDAQARGNFSETHAPHDVYPCQGIDAWCAVEVDTEEEWQALTRVMGEPAWAADERFATLVQRVANKEELDRNIGTWTAGLTPLQVMRALQKAGVPAGIVASGEDLHLDVHLWARPGAVAVVDHPSHGVIEHHGINVHLLRTPGAADRPSPLKGEHNDYVFGEVLGLGRDEIDRLVASGAIR